MLINAILVIKAPVHLFYLSTCAVPILLYINQRKFVSAIGLYSIADTEWPAVTGFIESLQLNLKS